MGVEHDVVDRKNRRVFELGKWYGVIPLEKQDVEVFVRRGMESYRDPIDAWRQEWLRRLWAFCEVAEWDVVMLYDGQTSGEKPGEELELVGMHRGPGETEAIFDGRLEGREEPIGARVYFVTHGVYARDEPLAPDPCKEAQAAAEARAGLPMARRE